MSTPLLRALVLGDTGPAEFQPVIKLVRQSLAAANLRWELGFEALRQATAAGWWPELIIILQAWPDQFGAQEVQELISLCPLARIVCCFGPWCDSDGRTWSIWPLGVRVPVAAFVSRFEHELALLAHGRDDGPPLPLTASRTEIFEFDFAHPATWRPVALDVPVISPDRCFREMIASALRNVGLTVAELHNARPPAAIVFDADPWDGNRAAELAHLRSTHPRSQLIACVGFSRPHVDAELRSAGVDAVWLKLAPLAELIEHATTRQ
jgi:hypothetical protein